MLSNTSILLISAAIFALVAMEFSIECMLLLDVVVEFVVGGFSLNPSHCMVFSAISSRNIHAASSVMLMKSPWLMDLRTIFEL